MSAKLEDIKKEKRKLALEMARKFMKDGIEEIRFNYPELSWNGYPFSVNDLADLLLEFHNKILT